MEVYAIRTQNKEETIHVYESLNTLPKRGVTDLHVATPTKVAMRGDNDCQKKILVILCVICVAFGAAIVTLSVMMYSMKIAFERNIHNQNRNFQQSIAKMEVNFTSLFATTKQETEYQKETLAVLMSDFKVYTNLTNEKLLDQQKPCDEKLHLFMEKESSKNKVSLTACAQYNLYNGGDSVLLPYINTKNGISSQVISSLKDTGIFTCEKSGLYLISIFMMTDEHLRIIYLYKNSTVIAHMYYSLNGFFQTNSATVIEQLTIGDTLTVKPNNKMYIWGNRFSCMSILQLTN